MDPHIKRWEELLQSKGFAGKIDPSHWEEDWPKRKHVHILGSDGSILEVTRANEYVRVVASSRFAPSKERPFAVIRHVSLSSPTRPKDLQSEAIYMAEAEVTRLLNEVASTNISKEVEELAEEMRRTRAAEIEAFRLREIESFKKMLRRGLFLGIGASTVMGWFEIEGFDKETGRALKARLVRSCSREEFGIAHTGYTLKHFSCTASENSGDCIRIAIEVVHEPDLYKR